MQSKKILIGFMGSGKTTIGKELAAQLKAQWIDLDEAIETKMATTIPYLFETIGEESFRQIESDLLSEIISTQGNSVLSTGGGVVEKQENRTLLSAMSTIYLKWEFGTLYERIAGDKNRPLVKSYEQLKYLYNRRQAFYEESARYVILCDNKTIDSLVAEIIEKVGDSFENSSY